MIDLNHPQSEYIFEAARYEDFVLSQARGMTIAPLMSRYALFKECEPVRVKMQKMNDEHFGAAVFITSVIEELRRCLTALAELGAAVDKKEAKGHCPACSAVLVDRVPPSGLPRQTYCESCLNIIMPALERLGSRHGFGTDDI